MRYLLKIVGIVSALLVMGLAVCAGENRAAPWIDSALECSDLPPDATAPAARTWPGDGPCAGLSVTTRFLARENGTVVACDPGGKAAVWQNASLVEAPGSRAARQCTDLCSDPEAPGDPTRCSAFCRDRVDPSRCDPELVGLAWRLPDVDELEALGARINGAECAVQGCRMDPAFRGECDDYWAADLEDPNDPDGSDRAYFDMRGGASGFDRVDAGHWVRCVAVRP